MDANAGIEKNIDISSCYSGKDNGWWVRVNGEDVHFSITRYEHDMFIAELKCRLIGKKVRTLPDSERH